MKTFTRLLTIVVFAGWVGSVNATLMNVLIEVDIADFSAVTFSATGAAPSVNEFGVSTLEGISLLGIFSAEETVNPGAITGDLVPHGATGSYNQANTLPSDFDLNLWCLGCGETQDFDTSFAAFTGVATVDLTGYSILGAGYYGDILDADNLSSGVTIGQWEIIDSSATVPLPSTLVLLGLGLAGLGFARRNKV